MIKAYILAKIETGKEEDIFKNLKKLREIKKAAATFGVYDLIIEVTLESVEKLDEFIFTKLRKIQGITETMSLITSKTIV
jgi:DNA-binding Lrp family transcriptional regulator